MNEVNVCIVNFISKCIRCVDADTLDQAKKEFLAQLKVFNNVLVTKPFLVGKRLTFFL